MQLNPDFKELLHILNSEGAKFIVVGAYAVISYTEPRYTKDIDLWINPERSNASKVWSALQKFGAPIKDLSVDDLTNPDLVFQMGMVPNRIDILMGIKELDFKTAWKNKRTIHYGDEKVYVLSLEDLIKNKAAVGRPQDKLDLEKLHLVKKG